MLEVNIDKIRFYGNVESPTKHIIVFHDKPFANESDFRKLYHMSKHMLNHPSLQMPGYNGFVLNTVDLENVAREDALDPMDPEYYIIEVVSKEVLDHTYDYIHKNHQPGEGDMIVLVKKECQDNYLFEAIRIFITFLIVFVAVSYATRK